MFDHHEYSATHTALLLCRILLVLISKEGLGPWHTTVLFISVAHKGVAATSHQNDVRKASFCGQKKFVFGLLSLSRKETRAHYLSRRTVRLSLKDLPSQSLDCISCLSSRYSSVSLGYATYQNSDNRFVN